MTQPLCFPAGLYGITPETLHFEQLAHDIESAARGGMRALQWRQKKIDRHVAVEKARAIAMLCRTLGVVFIVNDDVDLAIAIDADGVHLGKDDGDIAAARAVLGSGKLIGCSCYNERVRAEAAMRNGADYIAFGAVFDSSVKPEAVRAPLELFQQAQALRPTVTDKPVTLVAIGGITPQNADQVIKAGAQSLAVIGGLFNSPDIRSTAAQFSALF